MLGVVGGTRPGAQHGVVTGAFAFHAQTMRRKPGERVKPVQSAHEVREHVHRQISTADVRQLVQEDGFAPVGAPVVAR